MATATAKIIEAGTVDPGLVRVFPRRTRATPNDAMAFTEPPGLFPPEASAVHVSVAFTYDLPKADWLAKQWARPASVAAMCREAPCKL
jgi:hypothetical protein